MGIDPTLQLILGLTLMLFGIQNYMEESKQIKSPHAIKALFMMSIGLYMFIGRFISDEWKNSRGGGYP